MSRSAEIQYLLRLHRAVLIRERKDKIFRFPDGRIFVVATSPSDHRAERNNLATLRRLVREVRA
jgi:hypothetical protein